MIVTVVKLGLKRSSSVILPIRPVERGWPRGERNSSTSFSPGNTRMTDKAKGVDFVPPPQVQKYRKKTEADIHYLLVVSSTTIFSQISSTQQKLASIEDLPPCAFHDGDHFFVWRARSASPHVRRKAGEQEK